VYQPTATSFTPSVVLDWYLLVSKRYYLQPVHLI